MDKLEFDAIFSLGHNCQVATQLKRNRLRTQSGPFDWFNFTSTVELCQVLRNQFQEFMRLENLEVYGTLDDRYLVRDLVTSCLSFHDFQIVANEPPLFDYLLFRETLDRRIKRFLQFLSSNSKFLVIRTQISQQDSLKLYRALKETYPNPNIHFLFINESSQQQIIEHPSGMQQAFSMQIPYGKTWEGHDEAWKSVLERFSLKSL